MSQAQAQDIIDWIIGRGTSAPDAFVLAKWPFWMRLRPRPSPARRDALLALLAERAVVARPRRSGRRWPHWLALLCWQMGPEPAHDERWQRRIALLLSSGLHVVFVLLLVWVALVRSTPPSSEPQQRVALRFVSAGQGHVQGGEAGESSPEARPVEASPGQAAAVSGRQQRAAQATPAALSASVTQAQPPPQPLPAQASDLPVQEPLAAPALPAPRVQALPLPAVELPAVIMPVPERALSQVPPASAPLAAEPAEAALPAPQVRSIAPRAVDYAVEAEVSLPVPERELELRQQVQVRPLRAMPAPLPVPLSPPELAVSERSIALRQTAPIPRPMAVPVSAAPLRQPAPMTVPERDIAMRQAAPVVPGLGPGAAPVVAPPTRELTVREREISPALAAPVLRGLREPALSATDDSADLASTALPTVGERDISARAAASASAQRSAAAEAQAHGGQAQSAAGAAAQVRAASTGSAGAGQPSPVGALAPPAATPGPAGAANAGKPMAGSGQDWSRGSAGSDDWSRAGQSAGSASGLAGTGAPAGLRAADLPSAAAARGAPGGDNDQWTRQRLEAGGTWLRRPPPGHAPGRFDRYWVPNESLLAEWVRKGIKNVEIPLPGGSGSISCVISLLQLGGGCGVSDPNMQEQPAQARAAPDVPYKPALHNDSGSP